MPHALIRLVLLQAGRLKVGVRLSNTFSGDGRVSSLPFSQTFPPAAITQARLKRAAIARGQSFNAYEQLALAASPRQELKSAREVDSPPGAAFGAVPLPQHGAYAPVLPGVPEGSSAQRTTTFADFDGAAAYLLAAAQMRPAVPPLWDADVGASALVARSISASPGPGKANSASGASPRGPIGWDCSPDVASHDDIEARTAVADVTRRRSHGGIVSGGGVASAQGVAEVGGRKDGAARRVAEALKSREASRHW